MRYIITILWAFLLSMMVEFVLSSMLYVPFNFARGLIFTVGMSIFAFIFPLLMPKENEIYERK